MKPLISTAPAWSILNPAKAYTPAIATDLHALFSRINAQLASDNRATGKALRVVSSAKRTGARS